ncbi:DUF3089 domain-containing protein [Haliscomenobacter sp.]|uniref:DUF3089 domain-containing protein n=1 Tax=Haliscomenobacter sp. TaxID=2717303 RepID=UPI003364BC7F
MDMKTAPYLSIPFIALLFWACSTSQEVAVGGNSSVPPAPDYVQPSAWAALPDRKDAADEVPVGMEDHQLDGRTDIFFVYPTIYTQQREENDPWNADIADAKLNKKVDEGTIRFQASIFNGVGRVYAPRYRQANISAYWLRDQELQKRVFDVAYDDVRRAFQYYLDHYNQGRPIIIASHSQGTTHTRRLLKEFFDTTALRQRLVVAYLIGMPIEKDFLQNIPVCDSPDQTGCFCSWRTYLKGHYPEIHKKGNNIANTNPLNWSSDTLYASRELNKGAVLRSFKKIIPKVCDAQVHDGLLWVNKPKFPGSFLFNNPNYHIGDFNLFYQNVRENAATRVSSFKF